MREGHKQTWGGRQNKKQKKGGNKHDTNDMIKWVNDCVKLVKKKKKKEQKDNNLTSTIKTGNVNIQHQHKKWQGEATFYTSMLIRN